MRNGKQAIRLNKLAALAIVGALFWASRLPALPAEERAELASRFRFDSFEMLRLPGSRDRKVRAVHPSLERISAWISSVGAAAALMDLDMDGLPNDVCHVDPRSDQVIVSPLPETGRRFSPFELLPSPLTYAPSRMAPMGCLPADLNEDGLLDILVYYWGRTPVLFLKRAGTDTSPQAEDFVPQELLATGERWYTNAATQADLDGDGHLDLIFGNYFQDGARILESDTGGHPSQRMQDSMSRAFNGGKNRIFLGRGGTLGGESTEPLFCEATGILDERLAGGWTLAVGGADLDGDLLPELYFANDFGPDRLLHNRSRPGSVSFAPLTGIKTLETPSSKIVNRDSFKGMGVDFGDLNQDGRLDIYVSNIADVYALEESHFLFVSAGPVDAMKRGEAPYRDDSERLGLSRSGWGWETRFGDFDNDGVLEALQATGFVKGDTNRWPELHEIAMGNDELLKLPFFWPRFQPGDDLSGHQHNPFFVRSGSGRYFDLAIEIGLGRQQVSRGIATADVDGDGDLDFLVANQWEPSFFYRNEAPRPGSFLGLNLLLDLNPQDTGKICVKAGFHRPSNRTRAAIGAQATVRLVDGRVLTAQVDGGNGHSGVRHPSLHFGLGPAPPTSIQVSLAWRDLRGRRRDGTIELRPGWHTLILD